MTSPTNTPTAAVSTWIRVNALLFAAADRAYQDSTTDRAMHSTAVGTHGLALTAIALLPVELDAAIDAAIHEVRLEPTVDSMSAPELIRAAEAATRQVPIEQLPAGASAVIVDLCDLIRQTQP